MIAFLRLVTLVACISCPIAAQSSIRSWGQTTYDTASMEGGMVQIEAAAYATATLRSDGRIFLNGASSVVALTRPPTLANGGGYVDVSISDFGAAAVADDGSIVSWCVLNGTPPTPWLPPAPPLPPGIRYVDVEAGNRFALALRSDNVLVAWGSNQFGQCNVPPLPLGRSVVTLSVDAATCSACLDDGSLVFWGDLSRGQDQVPPLPAGREYTGVTLGWDFVYALRDDGQLVAWGSNDYGQLNVPSLPSGVTYTQVAVGLDHVIACRSDGHMVAWGGNYEGQCNAPALPPGTACRQVAAGAFHSVARLSNGQVLAWGWNGFNAAQTPALASSAMPQASRRWEHMARGEYHSAAIRSDGSVVAWGLNTIGQSTPPTSLQGQRFVQVSCGTAHTLARTEQGRIFGWGDNTFGQIGIPPLPPGVVYSDMTATLSHSVALRSDGRAVAFGANVAGCINVPQLPVGLTYTLCDARYGATALLRSDSSVVIFGSYYPSQVPPIPSAGLEYIDIGLGQSQTATIRSDGVGEWWGSTTSTSQYWRPLPQLSAGVYFVEVDANDQLVVWRSSDGNVKVSGWCSQGEDLVPDLDPGTSYLEISANFLSVAARVGAQSTYVGFHPGCSGTLPATRLVPRDTPKIGQPLKVNLFDLPVDIALLAMGFGKPAAPVSLQSFGMPGCSLAINPDAIAGLVGANHQARFELPIPNKPPLVGLRFYHQALVLDPGANGFGAVVSDAAEGVIGYP